MLSYKILHQNYLNTFALWNFRGPKHMIQKNQNYPQIEVVQSKPNCCKYLVNPNCLQSLCPKSIGTSLSKFDRVSIPMTCSSPRRAVCSHSLVCSENSLLIVGIGPILNKELKLIFRSDRPDRTFVYSQVSGLHDKLYIYKR